MDNSNNNKKAQPTSIQYPKNPSPEDHAIVRQPTSEFIAQYYPPPYATAATVGNGTPVTGLVGRANPGEATHPPSGGVTTTMNQIKLRIPTTTSNVGNQSRTPSTGNQSRTPTPSNVPVTMLQYAPNVTGTLDGVGVRD